MCDSVLRRVRDRGIGVRCDTTHGSCRAESGGNRNAQNHMARGLALTNVFRHRNGAKSVVLGFVTHIIPKKNTFRIGVTKTGKRYQYRPKDGAREAEHSLSWEALQQVRSPEMRPFVAELPKLPWKGAVGVEAVFRKTTGDLHGVWETMADALQKIVYVDDSQCVEEHLRWAGEGELDGDITALVRVWPIL